MEYNPIQENQKKDWIKWLEDQKRVLEGQQENENVSEIFKTPEGDVATAKDLVGNLLALLTNQKITIN